MDKSKVVYNFRTISSEYTEINIQRHKQHDMNCEYFNFLINQKYSIKFHIIIH